MTGASETSSITQLLARASAGDRDARDLLVPRVYDELRAIAGRVLDRHATVATLPPTALVHEAWLKLVDRPEALALADRRHFLAIAARLMRDVLVDHLRARGAAKRGGGLERVTLDDVASVFEQRSLDLLALDEALGRLAAEDPQLARIVELRFFGGLTIAETAQELGVSTPTVERGWRLARAWLLEALGGAESPGR